MAIRYYAERKTVSGEGDEPVTVTELKNYLQIEGTAYDTTLEILIKSARIAIEEQCKISLVDKTINQQFTVSGCPVITLPYAPIDAITTVEINTCDCGDWETLAYEVINEDAYNWQFKPDTPGKIRVVYTTTAETNTAAKLAVISQAAHMYTFRDDASAPKWSPIAEVQMDSLRNVLS
jgi:hypothetical protein